jgi:hypothetical protein
MRKIEEQHALQRFSLKRLCTGSNLRVIVIEDDTIGRLRELHREINLPSVTPGFGRASSGKGVVCGAVELSADHGRLSVVRVAVLEIDDDVSADRGILTGGEGIPVQPGALRGGQLGANAVVF